MKKNANVLKAYTVCSYTKDPGLTEAFKRHNPELAALRTGTFIF
ncbi:hypothetical protein [Chryseobacterium elymi]|nr:hypothetical protein [Chryseobacterium elymi]